MNKAKTLIFMIAAITAIVQMNFAQEHKLGAGIQAEARLPACSIPPAPAGDTQCLGGPGCLDPSFSGVGVNHFVPPYGAVDDMVIQGVALQADGRIVATGHLRDPSGTIGSGAFTMRLNYDGSIDTTFGDIDFLNPLQRVGYVVDQIGGLARTVVVQPDGRILVGGSGGENRVVVVRYTSDGVRDMSFDGDGIAHIQTIVNASMRGMVLQADGKIVVTWPTVGKFNAARLNSDGFLDGTFGTGGIVNHNASGTAYGDGSSQAIGIQVISGEERIVLGGLGFDATTTKQRNSARTGFALMRLLPSGAIDTSFGSSGRAKASFFGFGDQAYAMKIDSSNKIVLAGNARTSNCDYAFDAAIARFNPNGTLDTTFSGDGKATTDIYGSSDKIEGLDMAPDGKLAVFGYAMRYNGTDPDFVIVRYNTNGTQDNTFGSGTFGPGVVTANFMPGPLTGGTSPANWVYNGGVIQPDGRVIIAGTTWGTTPIDVATIARYMP